MGEFASSYRHKLESVQDSHKNSTSVSKRASSAFIYAAYINLDVVTLQQKGFYNMKFEIL